MNTITFGRPGSGADFVSDGTDDSAALSLVAGMVSPDTKVVILPGSYNFRRPVKIECYVTLE